MRLEREEVGDGDREWLWILGKAYVEGFFIFKIIIPFLFLSQPNIGDNLDSISYPLSHHYLFNLLSSIINYFIFIYSKIKHTAEGITSEEKMVGVRPNIYALRLSVSLSA
ncbi:hypothetical protein Dimus_038971 [Dionaea muscipula]